VSVDRPRRTAAILVIAVLALLCAAHFTSIPRTIWEYDESLFAMAVEKYEPLLHNPPPPGYPIYIAVATMLQPLFGFVPLHTLLAISAIATFFGFLTLFAAFRSVSGEWLGGFLGAILFYFSPAMLVHSTLPQSDSGALLLLALAIWRTSRAVASPSAMNSLWMAIACAVTVGWRLQFSIAVVPLFVTAVVIMRVPWRDRLVAMTWFAIGCLAWLVPLVSQTGGPATFWKWISGQAAYFAEHDADLSRGGMSPAFVAFRFVAHPWGPKWLAAPVLLLAIYGVAEIWRRKARLVLPVAVMTIVYLAFALWMMDPADGVRYALPAVAGVALLAGIGLGALHRVTRGLASWLVILGYGAGAWWYCSALLRQRATTPSTPVAAIRYLRDTAPRNAVILHDVALKPHASYLLRGFKRMKVDEGLQRYGHLMDVPLYELTDSASDAPGARVFRWHVDDAYNKLTRKHYAVTSVVPIDSAERFQAVEGISPPERTRSRSWRWISERGVIAIPDVGASHVRLTFSTPGDYPFDANAVTVAVAGGGTATVNVQRGRPSAVELEIPRGGARIVVTPARWFIPAQVPGRLSRDRRHLSVMLVGLQQVTRAAASEKRAG
jgi:hypothetical protein